MVNEQTIEKKTREKSALYPAVTIEQCVEFIKKISEWGGNKAISYSTIYTNMGLSSPHTKSFLCRISAAKQFGLITTGGNTAQLTEAAKHILNPINDNEKGQLLIEAFSKPPLYAQLIERFKNVAIPSKEQLANILMHNYSIIQPVKDKAAECFIKSANYIGLLQNGILYVDIEKDDVENETVCQNDDLASSQENDNIQSVQMMQPANQPAQERGQIQTQSIEQVQSSQKSGYNFEIPTLSGQTAKFYIPDGVTGKDISYIKLYIEKMLPVFLDNLKTEIEEEERKI